MTLTSLTQLAPTITGEQLLASLTPPAQFAHASFDDYRPDVDYPSQQQAVDALRAFSAGAAEKKGGGFLGLGRRKKQDDPEQKPGIYLDGGFGVGKTHLLAALWHAASGRKLFGTFIEYTALVGALGYAKTVELLRGSSLICIDEFELDDPGDTMMMTRLITDLVGSGTRFAATSNTPPNALGEGRFAASDFLREIHAMSGNFTTLRIDGLDFRRRATSGEAVVTDGAGVAAAVDAARAAGRVATRDDFTVFVDHLATVHPSRYLLMVDGVDLIALDDVVQLHDQMQALRLVAFIDRAYDAELPIVASGTPLSAVFDEPMLNGGFRKKYLRSVSRMIALTAAPPTGDNPS
ncbi:cell division protein ZapE [Gryllotalpicola protaetiae]|uniref:Cell division protein ZapE n=1 Tax=Gryllotalpicola protaetiae TaxID=2419771 RepID=A0A387BLD5_9MICO|nr:cell division protein ZapE [Gryllotalpicola protaetiae]AYG04995.1 cell division protein ZapE [Gryllotalpicola protaetiae]